MPVSRFLAKALGLYFLIVSTAMFVDMQQFLAHVSALVNDRPLMFLTGFISLIIGILMVTAHNFWQWHWALILTIIAWITLIKGIVLIFYPVLIQEFSLSYADSLVYAYSGAALDFLLGLTLMYFGFRKDGRRA